MFTPFSVTGCSLELLSKGEEGIVTFCKLSNEEIRKKLILMGIKLGDRIDLIQKFPFLQIKVNDINMAIDIETASAIYVRIIDKD
ncbi:ferrous iron transport protein A [Nostoc sp. T09]|uniref:FeoA family protein n=1 Tax=Nostoc sp. T09 TaxID=1932621 RepID=UPI000A3C88C6|nr:FeoA family protein [Nostoc sp. T09]OUL34615.1 ferrous iron transport protein A [Nostoc sp. T09]